MQSEKLFISLFFSSFVCVLLALTLVLLPVGFSRVDVTFHYEAWFMPVSYRFDNGSSFNIAVSNERTIKESFQVIDTKLDEATTASFTAFAILSPDLTVNRESMALDSWIEPSKRFLRTSFVYEVSLNLFKDGAFVKTVFHSFRTISPDGPDVLNFGSIVDKTLGDGSFSLNFGGLLRYSVDTSYEKNDGEEHLDFGQIDFTVQNALITSVNHSFNIIDIPMELKMLNPDLIRLKEAGTPVLLAAGILMQAVSFGIWRAKRR